MDERPGEFNENDVVAASDDDVCAKEDMECLTADEVVSAPETFTQAMDANFKIVDESRIQLLKLWNDALAEQIKECFKKNQTFENLIDSKIDKENAFTSLEARQKEKAAATLSKENAQANMNNILQLVTYYDQKRALARQQMMVCNQCPKMKIYQDAAKDADVAFDKFKAQYELAQMQAKSADLSVTNATLNSQGAEVAAARGVDSVTTLTQDLVAAEKTCDDKYPEEELAKTKYNEANDKVKTFKTERKKQTVQEMNKLLKDRRSRSYYLSMRAGSHINLGTDAYDAISSTTKGAMTLSLWVKINSLGHDSTLISSRGENGGEIYGWTLGVNDKDGFYFDVTTEGKAAGKVDRNRMKSGIGSMEITMNEWYNIAVTFGSEKKLYVNGYVVARGNGGEIVYQSLSDMAGAGMKSHAGRSFTIGALNDGSKSFNGGIDNIAVWNRENTAEEIQSRW